MNADQEPTSDANRRPGEQPDKQPGKQPASGKVPGEMAPNDKRYESVWDYPRPPELELVDFKIEVSHGGQLLASSTSCYRVLETSQPPAYYVPPTDVAVEFFVLSTTKTFCEWKGMASYTDLKIGTTQTTDAAWTYPNPTDRFDAIKGYWAFYAQKLDVCTVDGEVVDPNEGRFYGGWITSNITGPFKGGAGTAHW